MDLKTKTVQRVGDDFHAVIAELEAVAARLAGLQADARRALLLVPGASEMAQRPVNRLGVAERLVAEAKLEAQRSHKSLNTLAESMDIAVRCPERRGSADAAPIAKRA